MIVCERKVYTHKMVWCGKLMGNDDVNTKQQFNETDQNRIEQEPILSAAMHSFSVPYENTLFLFVLVCQWVVRLSSRAISHET